MRSLYVIAGPTAVGKSASSVILARGTDSVIVSADAYQCYRRMDIGTAKSTLNEMGGVPHYMIDVYEPTESIRVSRYASDASGILGSLGEEGRAVIVGGSGLYIDSIVFSSYSFEGGEPDEAYRDKLREYAAQEGNERLWERLKEADPEYAALTHPNNVKRVIRALEYHHSTGEKMSCRKKERVFRYPGTRYFVLDLDRQYLYPRIDERVDRMLSSGLVEEVRTVYEYCGYDRSLPSLKAIGYSEIIAYLEGETSLDYAVELVKQHSRNYAKRQYTWFRSDPLCEWITLTPDMGAQDIAELITERIKSNV
ncbi:MAG: tRNA (adenosine(37)-N6)-dimethylallyltransferase MiaA [Eubacteriaceae bacterium]|nr:tRNA (adenosine(37)-N6)-dimethylallyltransferase MiaA [Eubacteriaceae bacterium]